MLRKIKIVFTFLLVAQLSLADCFAASAARKVCVKSDGSILVKAKCKKGETLLSSASLNKTIATSQDAAGPSGSPGVTGIKGITGNIGVAGPQGAQGVVGPKGAPGQINFSACRLTTQAYDTNFQVPSNPVLYAEVSCNPNTEYILEDESIVSIFPDSAGTKVVLQGRLPFHQNINGDVREYAVGIFANRFATGGSGIYELLVRAVCCPR